MGHTNVFIIKDQMFKIRKKMLAFIGIFVLTYSCGKGIKIVN